MWLINIIVTEDMKKMSHNNVAQKRNWLVTVKSHQTVDRGELSLCIWCDFKGPIYYKLLQINERINSEKCCAQQFKDRNSNKTPYIRHGVVFNHDNSLLHVLISTQLKL